jgi:hypothetical protein
MSETNDILRNRERNTEVGNICTMYDQLVVGISNQNRQENEKEKASAM